MNGYAEALKIDDAISDVIDQHNIMDNPDEWISFVRTLRGGLDLVEEIAQKSINKKTKKVAATKSGNSTDSYVN